MKLHFVVYGVGAVGGFYGGLLGKFLHNSNLFNLSFVARGSTKDALLSQGLSLTTQADEISSPNKLILKNLNVVDDFNDIKFNDNEYSVILVCVKSKDTIEVAKKLKNKLKNNSCVISIQNGVENESVLAEVLTEKLVIGALTNVAAHSPSPGEYFQKGAYTLVIGELENNLGYKWQERLRVEVIAEVLAKAGIKIARTDKIKQKLWEKLVWNAGFNPTSVFYKATIGELYKNPEAKKTIIEIMQEVKKVAFAIDCPLPEDIDKIHIEKTSEPIWNDFKTSTLQDFERGRPIEIEELLGVIVRLGKVNNIQVPASERLYDILKASQCGIVG